MESSEKSSYVLNWCLRKHQVEATFESNYSFHFYTEDKNERDSQTNSIDECRYSFTSTLIHYIWK